VTSHVCIIARSKGLPALLGVDIAAIPEGARLLVDAPAHRLVIDPAPEDLAVLAATSNLSAPLRRIPLYGNAGSVEDVRAAMEAGADGIGVFRTELMFMQSATLPTEEEQFAAYREAALICKGKPLIIRTLDIGGDKPLPYLDLPREDNPYLGFRAIRLCLDRPEELFKPQLRALLRASAYGDVRILLPMVISVGEVRAVRDLLEECKRELDAEAVEGRKRELDAEAVEGRKREPDAATNGLPAAPYGRSVRPYNPAIPVGVMVETPAAALIAEDLAQEADFFSLGTNDLTQYILAADRGNPAVARYYDSLHPAVLRAIAMTVAAAHGDARPDTPGAGRRIPVCVCGEMAADPAAAEKLLALGVDSLSLSSPSGIAALKCRMGTGT
jgi:phosphotransferase system enzyme I (PtsI)